MVNLFILTGASGAGKTTVTHVLEEMGYFIVENVPLQVAPILLDTFETDEMKYEKSCIVVSLEDAEKILKLSRERKNMHIFSMIVDATKSELMLRFKLTRHVHPLQCRKLGLNQCLDMDSKIIQEIRPIFDDYIDTTGLSVSDLRKLVLEILRGSEHNFITIEFSSFGYKHGVPNDAEIMFDTRTLPNPFWVPSLKTLTGNDKEVYDYVFSFPQTQEFVDNTIKYLDYILDAVSKEQRSFFVVAIGCSGGQHRSVVIANYLSDYYKNKYNVITIHRDVERFRNR
jgi:RNase adapter protein RapZ